ncbi:VOC family protein [Yoonia sp. R2-816]|uniref:VOC family protein n=1 Tax=Yoonia sp. R2-816 TaxID=3342638 RepID=UPI003726B514
MQLSNSELVFDHIAVVARSLEEGASYIGEKLGIEMPPGGSHPIMGTHNLLLSLGSDCFLEVIAIDPKSAAPNRSRWFGLDGFDAEPRIGAWILGAGDIRSSLDGMQETAGPIIEMTRSDLTWLMSVREDGAVPLSGAFPKVLQWPEGPHVASKMGQRGCSFASLTVESPNADDINTWLDGKLDDPRIKIGYGETRLTAVIETPSGPKVLC